MASITFSKWQGTGNDFILIDDRDQRFPAGDPDLVRRLCDRHFGIGSDGLILLQQPHVPGTAFHMEFYNPDASRSFCGNGSRCAFAFHAGLAGNVASGPLRFTAIDGEHEGTLMYGSVTIGMKDVGSITEHQERMDIIHTGSPHVVVWVEDPGSMDVVEEGRRIRNSAPFAKEGINVNFVRWANGALEMRTYERGVENETLSCGTGVTAAALSAMARGHADGGCDVITCGGRLSVQAARSAEGGFRSIKLIGPAQEVFKGVFNTTEA